MPRRFLRNASLLLVLFAITGSRLWADHGRDPQFAISQHAAALADHSRELYDELRLHYRGHPAAASALADVLQLHRSARRMIGYAEAHLGPSTLEREMWRMESAYHQLEQTMWEMRHPHGSHRHIQNLLRCSDDLVHDLHEDIHRLSDRRFFAPAALHR